MLKESRYSLSAASAASSKTGSPTKGFSAARKPSKVDDTAASKPAGLTPRRTSEGQGLTPRRGSDTGQTPREGERVRVFVRVRPTKPEETSGGLRLKPGGNSGVVIYREHASIPVCEYEFDRVLPPSASQSDVYTAAVKPVVEDVLSGYNGTVMAYGQTGAGKTFTLSSIKPDAIGMIPRAAAEVFSSIAADTVHEYSVCLSYVQIYMELIQDLLRPESENLQIRENESGVFISGVQQVEVKNIEQCLHLLQLGDRNRATAFTALNAHSSRSHAVVMLTVVKRKLVAGTGEAEIQRVKIGKLFLVDLAGSERLKKSRSTGLRATEAKSINLSLTTLGMCINARADPNASHVPFRDSKLTRLLQESLGGNAKTSLVIAVSDAVEHVDETTQSLQFGVRAMRVKIQAVVNERVDYKSLHADLIAVLEGQDQKSALLEKSLLAKETQLEAMSAQLREEKEANERIVMELQREREAAEAEKDRLLQEQQAQLEAVQRHKQSLLQKLEETQVHTEGLRAQHEEQRAQLIDEVARQRAQLEAAALHAEEAALQHELAMDELKSLARREQAQLQQRHEEERVAADAAHAVEAAALRQQLAEREQRIEELQGQLATARARADETMQQAQAAWGAQLSEAQAAATQQLAEAQTAVAQREGAIAELRGEVASREGEIVALHKAISGLEDSQAELQQHNSDLRRHAIRLEQRCQQLEDRLAEEQQRVEAYESQLEAYERSRMNLAKSFFEERRLNHAARTIQRAYRAHRSRRLKAAQQQRAQALQEAHSALGSLEQQRAELEWRRRNNLAFSGQTLVGDSLGVLQEAVEGLITAFLLPAKDLRTLQTVKQRVSHYGGSGAKNPLLAASMAAPQLVHTSANPDLIKAVNPLAASLAPHYEGGAEGGAEAGSRGAVLSRMFSMSSPFGRKQALQPQAPASQSNLRSQQ